MRKLIAIIALAVSTAVCGQTGFPYPSIPQELRTPEARGAYLLEHYWDGYDFGDTTLVHRPEITEQGWVNFIDLLPRLDSTAVDRGVEVFAWRAFGPGVPAVMRDNMATLVDHYLYDPNSPMRSDELYMLFLQRMSASPAFSTAERERYAYRLKNLAKNSVGAVATDFAYVDRKGVKRTLMDTEGEYVMLYFNDPDCEVCHAVTELFAADSLIADNGRLKVVAVYPDADTDEWRSHKQPFPPSWTDAYSPGGEVGDKQLYYIRATPTIYILDREKRVVLKDPQPELVLEWAHNVLLK